MKTPSFLTLIVSALVVGASAFGSNPVDFSLKSATGGSSFQLSEHKGKAVALHFLLKTECPYCMKHTRAYAALAATMPDVIHVFIKPDAESDIKKWAGKLPNEELKAQPTIYQDDDAKLADKFGIPGGYKFHGQSVHYPALILLGGDGTELFRYVGKSNADRMSVEDFTAMLAQKLPKK